MALKVNLGDENLINNCCVGDYLLNPESLRLYRIVRGTSTIPILIIDVELAITVLFFDSIDKFKNSDFYKEVILIPESEFVLIKK